MNHANSNVTAAQDTGADTGSDAVRIAGLNLSYGNKAVLKGLNWHLPAGQVVGLLGRNGAGKTSLLETMLGLRDDATGQIELLGCNARALDDATRGRIGYVPQQSNLFEWMTPAQLLGYFKSFYPRWNDHKVSALLDRWAIDPHLLISKLSGGQQQRLSIIRALAHEPDLLVLDEPVASLDPAGRRDFLQELVSQVIDRQTTVVFSTHILSDLERVAFNVAFLASGRIALQAPLDELMDSARRITGPVVAVRQLLQSPGWQALHEQALPDGRCRALARRTPTAQSSADAQLQVEAVTLEDLFLELTQ